MQIEEIIQGKKGKLIIRAEGGLSFLSMKKSSEVPFDRRRDTDGAGME